jgi:Spy/CpxP family protein refolding chaperone
MRKTTYSILLAALVTSGASVAVAAASNDAEAEKGERSTMGGMDTMHEGMMNDGMMSEMRQMMKDCREMMDTMKTKQSAE